MYQLLVFRNFYLRKECNILLPQPSNSYQFGLFNLLSIAFGLIIQKAGKNIGTNSKITT
jgi:hypothetical protein